MSIEGQLRSFICECFGIDEQDVDLDTELFSSGMLDSFSMVSLVEFIEQTASIKFGTFDLNMSNLDSISAMLAFVESKT